MTGLFGQGQEELEEDDERDNKRRSHRRNVMVLLTRAKKGVVPSCSSWPPLTGHARRRPCARRRGWSLL